MSDLFSDFTKLKLEYNSHEGIEKYISNFEEVCLLLDEAGYPEPDIQKKTRFLSGIHDQAFDSISTFFRFDASLTFEDVVKKFLASAKAIGKLSSSKSSRNANRSKRDKKKSKKERS